MTFKSFIAFLFCIKPEHPSTIPYKNAQAAHKRYFQSGNLKDLNDAIANYRDALTSRRRDHHEDLAQTLVNCAAAVWVHYEQTGKPASELEETIRINEEAKLLWTASPPKPERFSVLLTNLGNAYLDKYRTDKSTRAFDKAISNYESALSLNPSPTERKNTLIMLGTALWTRCDLQKLSDRLDEAIDRLEEALSLCGNDPQATDRAQCLFNLANAYHIRYDLGRNTPDLEQTIRHHTAALAGFPPNHLDRPGCFYSLSRALWDRHNKLGAERDLEGAKTHASAASKIVRDEKLRASIDELMGVIEERRAQLRGPPSQPSSPIDD